MNSSETHWKSYQEYTEGLTLNARKLAFAGIGVCWVLKDNNFPAFVSHSLFWFVLYFFFDILQYFVAAISLRVWLRLKEIHYEKENGSLKGDYTKPAWLDISPFILWFFKIVFLCIAYIYLGIYIFNTFSTV